MPFPEPVDRVAEFLRGESVPRIPIRWRWTLWVGGSVTLAVVVFALIILDMERDAWLDSQTSQAEIMVARLGDELKLPMLSGSAPEIDTIANSYIRKVPSVLGMVLEYKGGKEHLSYGLVGGVPRKLARFLSAKGVVRLQTEELWFATRVVYAGTTLGIVAVHYSEQAWDALAARIMWRMLMTAVAVILFSGIGVYWLAARMSRPLEALASAARRVAEGDYSVHLPVQGNDEISDAVNQFNRMVAGLAHKEEMRAAFGRYLNPKLVEEVFADGKLRLDNHRQEVSILFADMVGFTSFSESLRTEQVVEVLNRFFELFHHIIDHFGGHVDKYIGDAVMGVFNHPQADPAHPRHAAMAALAMARACRQLDIRHEGQPITFRIGIDCGQVIAGSIGSARRLDYTVIGDTVNIASRMGALGDGGDVMLTHEAFHRLGKGFVFESIGRREIKGLRQPMECGRLGIRDEQMLKQILDVVSSALESQRMSHA